MKKVTFLIAALICGAWCATAQNNENGHEYVDLGLSSGVCWATCNVGATSPEEYGDYFAWGETETKATYDWSTYFDTTDGGSTFTEYTVGGKTVLDLDDDAARVNLGGAWRMPTREEINELLTACTWTYTTTYNDKNVKGYVVTSKTNDNSIFLPAAGYQQTQSSVSMGGSIGYYWTSNLYTASESRAWVLWLNQSNNKLQEDVFYRYTGRSVRAVCVPGSGSTTALQPATAAVNVYTTAGRIVCEGEFRIYDLLGRDVTRLNGSLCGVYVVKTADTAVKVVVK
ncbi:MAG: hypothetical protein ACI392_08900 [Paludibacteraceae bacterium]